MTFTATLKNNYSDLNFGYAAMGQKAEWLGISIHQFYNENDGILVAFKVRGNDEQIDHLKASDGAIYMTLNEMKWLSHHLNDSRFSQLKSFFQTLVTM